MKRRAEEISYDRSLIDNIIVRFEEFVLKGAKSTVHVTVPKVAGDADPAAIPTRSSDVIPRRLYLKPADFDKHGFTQGCPGCAFAQTRLGKDESDGRIAKVKG